MIIDVSGKLLQQFVDCLESSLVADLGHDHEPQPAAVAEQAPEHVPERVPAAVSEPAPRPMQEVAPVDLMAVARGPVLKRAAPLFGLVAIVVVALACRRHLGSAEPRRGKP